MYTNGGGNNNNNQLNRNILKLKQSNYCHIGSPLVFNRTCKDLYNNNNNQYQYQQHRFTQSFMSLLYTYCKQHLLPQIEGPYSFYLIP
ncbi:hypothetical protein BLA29_011029 [Euroglyphus maynei]|uniref:Uncharacterized protein n=1 Tax=Euroglyphus maynei TaxID=6958 RepID=A0A1Y3BQM0_EURMA|nr:hypothetical protein BLA29_011029 [Euroglyphus maynei]